ncbi:ATP-binding protein [Donghicola eburneus]|uniref:ORC1/DEAH AAA+ ATPase domain-containing protein n=1 Tax=Donghicola eburneus TaxID=393278 RepID=A0A1M4N1K0_9RHOB|nr:ATP-binding protein [Donghicola eburneus]SCM68732.1 hypothetical protein KARMA_2959 [Donghicola eburneus]
MTKTKAQIARIVAGLRDIHIKTDRDRAIRNELELLFSYGEDDQLTHHPVRFTGGTETHGITFIEGSGGGKTTAILKVLRDFEPLALNPETGAPRWLFSKVESPATLRSLGVSILQRLGVDRVSDRAKVYEIWEMVRVKLKTSGISLLWLDEAHDLFKDTVTAETNDMFKMLKSMMQGDHPVVLVLSGTERLEAMTGIDAQVNRRFVKIKPQPLAYGTDNGRIEVVVRKFAEKAELESDISGEIVARLIRASRFRFGRCIELTIRAIHTALMDGADALRIEHFQVAFAEIESADVTKNIFISPDWQLIELADDDDAKALELQASARNPNKKKKVA